MGNSNQSGKGFRNHRFLSMNMTGM